MSHRRTRVLNAALLMQLAVAATLLGGCVRGAMQPAYVDDSKVKSTPCAAQGQGSQSQSDKDACKNSKPQ